MRKRFVPRKPCFYISRGFWVADWRNTDGRRKILRLPGATTREEAQQQFEQRTSEIVDPDSVRAVQLAFEKHVIIDMRRTTRLLYSQMFGLLHEAGIVMIEDIRSDRLRTLLDKLVDGGSGPANRHKILRTAKRFFRWAAEAGYIDKVPTIPMPRFSKKSKGRPLTPAEFALMLQHAEAQYKHYPERAEQCKKFLWGLWEGALRISEMDVSWDDPFGFHVDWKNYQRPVFVMPDSLDKTGQARVFPMTQEFWCLIKDTPEEQRHGPIFSIPAAIGDPVRLPPQAASKFIARIGKSAGIVVGRYKRGNKIIEKYASAHDFRRSFGFRWSQRVSQMILMQLMRHKDPNTTAIYYIGTNAAAMMDTVWRVT